MSSKANTKYTGPYDPTTGKPWTKEAFYAQHPEMANPPIDQRTAKPWPATPTTPTTDPPTDRLTTEQSIGKNVEAGQLRTADDNAH